MRGHQFHYTTQGDNPWKMTLRHLGISCFQVQMWPLQCSNNATISWIKIFLPYYLNNLDSWKKQFLWQRCHDFLEKKDDILTHVKSPLPELKSLPQFFFSLLFMSIKKPSKICQTFYNFENTIILSVFGRFLHPSWSDKKKEIYSHIQHLMTQV